MRNIEPWCISRQLWWGHRIPAWYGPKFDENDHSKFSTGREIFVALTEVHAIEIAREHYRNFFGRDVSIELSTDFPTGTSPHGSEGRIDQEVTQIILAQDPDVLDTWFSSGLWPFSTLGWPDATPELGEHYPNSILVTAFDIIFFWVARMMMMGLYTHKEVPFPEVLIHGLVVDEQGQKMSKSKGNGVDPLDLIDKFGADALRFSLAAQAAQGRNVRISESRVEGYRNFTTKLWNAARFCEMNECKPDPSFDPANATLPLSQWIIHEANKCAADVTREIEAFRFNDATGAVYRFAWNIFCDWHVELAKPVFFGDDDAAKKELRAATAYAFDQLLKLLHPFMPFVSEELWGAIGGHEKQLMVSDWPVFDKGLVNDGAADELNWMIGLITAVRSVRAEMNVPAGAQIEMLQVGDDAAIAARLETHGALIKRLARIEKISAVDAPPKGAVQVVHDNATYALPLGDVIDLNAEMARLQKEIDKVSKEIAGIDKKLANKNFVDKAPAKVVEEQHTRRADFEAQAEKLNAAMERLRSI